MHIDKNMIGRKIRQKRIELGFSQEGLSEKIDISPRHMCTIENGNSIPSLETFVKISNVLGIDMNVFFNISPVKEDLIRKEIYDLIQISTHKELILIKKLISAIQENRD